jgi:hypothetical protein
MGCHITHAAFKALRLTAPISVKAEVEPSWRDSPARRKETWPRWQIVRYTYPGTDLTSGKTIRVTWSDGGKYPPDELLQKLDGDAFSTQGALFVGEQGAVMQPHGSGPLLYPKEKLKAYPRPKQRPRDHYLDYVDACLGKAGALAPFRYAGPLTEAVLVGTVALRCPDRELKWSGSELAFTDDSEANAYIRRTYRKGWEVKGLS